MSDGTDVFFMDDENYLSADELMNQLDGDNDPAPEPQERRVQVEPQQQKQFTPQQNNNDRDFKADIYKKWFKTKDKSGFLSLRGWLEAGKISFDIGEVINGDTKNTLAWADAIEVASFLRAVANGSGTLVHPEEQLEVYGGFEQDGQPISRVLKIAYWKGPNGPDKKAFAFKCGHFKARKSSSGAFIPDMKSALSINQIKVTRSELAQMSYRLDLAIYHFASTRNDDIFKALNGDAK